MDSRMDSREEFSANGQRLNVTTENPDTIALQKKGARRVSFAENTTVHVFDREEESNETPSRKNANVNANSAYELGSDVKLQISKVQGGQEDDDNIDYEDEGMEMRSFLRPISSPSPGGSTFGSASSNDEDNLFGPVLSNFINPGRLSDSPSSNDNNDITMDSTAFSMHYSSLARSDSGADSKTPSVGQLFLEEKTPINENPGRSMAYSLDTSEVSGGHSFSDMSLVMENPNKYEYEKLSPGLDVIILENMKTLLPNGVSDDGVTSMPNQKEGDLSPSVDRMYKLASLNNDVRKGICGVNSSTMLNGGEPASEVEFTGASGHRETSPNILPHHSSNNESHTSCSTSASSVLRAATSPSEHLLVISPLLNETGSLLRDESIEFIETSIQKSIEKLKLLEKSASPSAFSAKVDRSTIKALFNHDTILERPHHISENVVDNSVGEVDIDSSHESKARSRAFSIESRMVKHGTPDTSPPVTAWPENNLVRSSFKTRPSSEDAVISEIETSAKISSGGGDTTKAPEVVSSPYGATKRLLLPSTSLQSGQSNDLFIQQSKQGSEFEKGQDLTSRRNLADANLSTTTDNMDSVSRGLREVVTSPFGGGYRLKDVAQIRTADNGIVDTYDKKELTGILDKTISHSKENKSLISHPRTMDVRSQISSKISMVENGMNITQHKTIPHCTISPNGSRILNWSSLHKNLVEIPRASPSRNELDNMHASEKPTSETVQLSGRRDNLSSSKKKIDLSPIRKNEIMIAQRSPKRQKFDDCELLCPDERRLTLAGQSNSFIDVYSKNLDDMKCFFSESASRIHSDMIDAMEDILASQQRSKMYEMFSRELMSQNPIVLHDGWHKKMADTNSLLHRVVFEKMKLQLKHVKKERLLKRLQQLNSGIQESQVLRANLMPHPFVPSNANTTAIAISYPALSAKLGKGPEVSSEKLTAMRHSLETLEMEISNLTKSFHERCKLKAKPSSGGVIAAFNEHLIKIATCRLLQSDIQIWAFNGLTSSSCEHNVDLSYLDLVIQRIQVMRGPRLSAKTSFIFNEGNIMKNSPNIDACTAFAFLFRESVHERFDSRTLQWETQVTSSLLGTLLDVVNELQLAQMELGNLTQSRFCSPADQLHLVLCFVNWTNYARKVTLTLDMTCLKRGIYPSDIVPVEVKCSSSGCSLDELKEEVKAVETGYMRILRLCRSVSKWLQASTP